MLNCIKRDSVLEEEVAVLNSITSGIRRVNLKLYVAVRRAKIGNEVSGKVVCLIIY